MGAGGEGFRRKGGLSMRKIWTLIGLLFCGNLLAQDYPTDRLQIVVVSDCSDDGTDEIVRSYESRGVKLVRREVRQGKAAGLNEAVRHATGEIIVFSDANAELNANVRRPSAAVR